MQWNSAGWGEWCQHHMRGREESCWLFAWISFLGHWVFLWCRDLLYILIWHRNWAVCVGKASLEVLWGWGGWIFAERIWCILVYRYESGDFGGPNLGWCRHKVFPPSRVWFFNLLWGQKSGVEHFLYQRILPQSFQQKGWIVWVSISVYIVLSLSWFGYIRVLLIVFCLARLQWDQLRVGRSCIFGFPRIRCRLVFPSCVGCTVVWFCLGRHINLVWDIRNVS